MFLADEMTDRHEENKLRTRLKKHNRNTVRYFQAQMPTITSEPKTANIIKIQWKGKSHLAFCIKHAGSITKQLLLRSVYTIT